MESLSNAVTDGSIATAAVVPSLIVVQPVTYVKNAEQAAVDVSKHPVRWCYRGVWAFASSFLPSSVMFSVIQQTDWAKHTPLPVVGAVGRMLSAPLECACETVGNYQQVHGGSTVKAVKQIYNTHGYKGFVKASAEMAVCEGGWFGSMLYLTPLFARTFEEDGAVDGFVGGEITAGIIATVLTNGIDSRKTRLQRNPQLVETLRETCRWANWKKGMGWRFATILTFAACVPDAKSVKEFLE